MATTTRSHSRLTSMPGIDILAEISQLQDQIRQLKQPSEDVHNTLVQELERKIRDKVGGPEGQSTIDDEFHDLSDELREEKRQYRENWAAWEEQLHDLRAHVREKLRQFCDVWVARSEDVGTFDLRWNPPHSDAPSAVNNTASVDGHPSVIVSQNVPPITASSATNVAAAQTQPSGHPTPATARTPTLYQSAYRPDTPAEQQQNPSDSPAPRQSQSPRNEDRFITFDEVFGNGNATHKYIIYHIPHTIRSPEGRKFWILRCEKCNLHFSSEKGEGATLQSALKHIRSDIHGGRRHDRASVLRRFGKVVRGCSLERSRQNNEAVIAAIRNGKYVPETRIKRKRRAAKLNARRQAEAPNARRSVRRPNQATETVSGEPTPTISVSDTTPSPPQHHPTEVPTGNIADHLEPGEIYIIQWNGGSRRHAKEPYAGVLLPMGDFESVGLRGSFHNTPLAAKRPSCYRTLMTGDWKEEYKDGGPKANERKYPFLCVDKTTSIDDCSLDWIRKSEIRQFDEHAFHVRYRHVLDEYRKRAEKTPNAEQGHIASDPSTPGAIPDRRPSPFEDETTIHLEGEGISRVGRERTIANENAAVTNQPGALPKAPQSQQPSDFGGTFPCPPPKHMAVIEVDQNHLYNIDTIDFAREFLADAEPIPSQPHGARQSVPTARMHSHTPSLHWVDDTPIATPSLAVNPLAESTRRLNRVSSTTSWLQDKEASQARHQHAQQGPPLSPWSLREQMIRSGNVSPMSEALL